LQCFPASWTATIGHERERPAHNFECFHPRFSSIRNLRASSPVSCLVKPRQNLHRKSLRSSILRKTRSRMNRWNRRTGQLKTKNSARG
jgi:hypothetical protein